LTGDLGGCGPRFGLQVFVRADRSQQTGGISEGETFFRRGLGTASMQAWKRFRRLDGPQRRIVVAAAATLTTTWLALRTMGFRRSNALVMRFASSPPSTRADIGSSIPSAREIARLTHATARSLPFACNCLDQSLALCWLLRRRGLPARLRIGARKEGTLLQAHAWVESEGAALSDAGAEHRHFVPLEGAAGSFEPGSP
jgi:Transglutaminase-like superfamily